MKHYGLPTEIHPPTPSQAPAAGALSTDDDDFLTVDEVSKKLHLSRSSVYSIMEAGDLRFHIFSGRARRISRRDLREYTDRTRQPKPSERPDMQDIPF